MFWKMTTGVHGLSVDPTGVNVWVTEGHSTSGTTISHLRYLDGEHQHSVHSHHGAGALKRSISECHRYVEPTVHEALVTARLGAWRALPDDPSLESVAADPEALGQQCGRRDPWSIEFNPLERVVLDAHGATWSAADRRHSAHPTRASCVLVAGDWLYAVDSGLHIFSKAGESMLAAHTSEPAMGINPWGFNHRVDAYHLFRRGNRVVTAYSVREAPHTRALVRLIGPHGLVELCPHRGLVSRYSTGRFQRDST